MDTIHLVYDSLKAFDQFSEKVHFSFRTFTLIDYSERYFPFCTYIGAFQREPITLDMQVKGTVDQHLLSSLEITADDRQFRLSGMYRFRNYRVRRMQRMCTGSFPNFPPTIVVSVFGA